MPESHSIDLLEGTSWLLEDQEERPIIQDSLYHSQSGETSFLLSSNCERQSKSFGESMNATLDSPPPLDTVMDSAM